MAAFRDAYLDAYRTIPLSILDVGSAAVSGETAGYRPLFATPPWTYRGLDMQPGENVDLVPQDPYHWSALPDRCIDVVVSGQAFEHIQWPWLTMLEIARVLRGGGLAAITAPSSGPVHRFPVDCWRYYPDGLPALAAYAGLTVVETHWDEGYAYPENAFWGDAYIVVQKPRQGAGDSAIMAAVPRDAIARRVRERIEEQRPSAVRVRLLAALARRAWFILRSPLPGLTRF